MDPARNGDPDMRFGMSVTGSGLQITAEFRWARISYMESMVINEWINDESAQYACLEDAMLDAHHFAEIRPQAAGRRHRTPDHCRAFRTSVQTTANIDTEPGTHDEGRARRAGSSGGSG